MNPIGQRWPRESFACGAEPLAAALLGRLLVRRLDDGRTLAGRIVETEAYIGVRDRASHAFGGRRTPRNEAMYGPPGTAYVYFTYGMHHCFNVVCGEVGEPVAVLIRALEPVEGVAHMTSMRQAASRSRARQIAPQDLCRGPARLCQAMVIDRTLDGLDLVSDPRLWIAEARADMPDNRVLRTQRVGVDYAGAWARRRLRWMFAGHSCVSVPPAVGRPSRTPAGV